MIRHDEALLRECRYYIARYAWAGGASKGYYCRHCRDWRNNKKMPKTSYRDIIHTPECIISRIDEALVHLPNAREHGDVGRDSRTNTMSILHDCKERAERAEKERDEARARVEKLAKVLREAAGCIAAYRGLTPNLRVGEWPIEMIIREALAEIEMGKMTTVSNRSGGIQDGISNGMAIDLRLAFKPTATWLHVQASATPIY